MEHLKDLLVNVLSPLDAKEPVGPSMVALELPRGNDPKQKAQFLKKLKKQLNKILDDMGENPKPIREQLRPQTLKQVKMLEKKFKAAEHELQRLKIELSGQ